MEASNAANHRYQFGGLVFDSSVRIDLLRSTNHQETALQPSGMTFHISTQPLLSDGELVHTWRGTDPLSLYKMPGAWVFRYPTGIEFRASLDGSKITCFTGAQRWSPALSETLVRRILPRVIVLHDRHVIHASSLATPHGGILLCGFSHSGKSTLAAGLSQVLGWGVLDDDASILTERSREKGQSDFKLYRVGAKACLWGDSVDALSDKLIRTERLSDHENKYRCELPNGHDAEVQQLRAIYQLSSFTTDDVSHTEISVEDLPAHEAMMLLVRHQVRFNPTDTEAETKRMSAIARMVASVPIRTFRFPKVYDRLPEVCERLRDDMIALSQDSD